MVMEYLDGQDLSALLAQSGPLPATQAVDFVIQACDAIAEAHRLGIVHRDLKPANLFCIRGADRLLFVKVLDFGISKVSNSTAGEVDMTRTSTTMGSPVYMSPEQLTSPKGVDARTDIWALGVVLYELLTGQLPFQGDALPELCVKIATEAPPSLRRWRPDLPDGLEHAVLKCLEKDRLRRYQNVAELAHDLAPFGPEHARLSLQRISRIVHGSDAPRDALVTDSGGPSSGAAPAETAPPCGNTDPPRDGASKKRGAILLAFATVAVAAVALVSVLLFRARAEPPPAASRSAPVAATEPPARSHSSPAAAPNAAASAAVVVSPAESVASRRPARHQLLLRRAPSPRRQCPTRTRRCARARPRAAHVRSTARRIATHPTPSLPTETTFTSCNVCEASGC
jgi:eukaryotic-like serine/threonine-protein kinase